MPRVSNDLSTPQNSKPEIRRMCILYTLGHIFFIGGHADYRFPQTVSRAVSRLCIADGSSRMMRLDCRLWGHVARQTGFGLPNSFSTQRKVGLPYKSFKWPFERCRVFL